ncbi:hypothetical protein HAX54_003786, partial [Datura stramonium]|nr:hypothetical protein [Datura stramonium]
NWLIDAIKEMLGFAKYLKMFLTRKLPRDKEELILVIHRVSAIIPAYVLKRKKTCDNFTMPFRIDRYGLLACPFVIIGQVLSLDASSIYKHSGLSMT